MKFKVSIKTQTLRYTKNNGFDIVAHPAKGSQVDSLLGVRYVYFLGCGDYKIPKTIGHPNWLTKEQSLHFQNRMIVYPKGYNDPWFNIPIGHKATKDWFKVVGKITDKDDLEHLRHMGNGKWQTYNGYTTYSKNKKNDTNVMGKKGTIGEEIIKRYFQKQEGVNNVLSSGSVYAKWDLEVDYSSPHEQELRREVS
jgi:hypothetical protein